MSEKQQATEGQQQEGGSGTFTPPQNQAEFEQMLSGRLARERAKFADYDELKSKATEFDKVLEANKTEAQKQAEALAAAEAKVQAFETAKQVEMWKDEVANAAEDLTPEQKLRIRSALAGSTKEAIEAHAETLKSMLIDAAGSRKGSVGPYVPPEGGSPSGQSLNGDALEEALKSKLGIA